MLNVAPQKERIPDHLRAMAEQDDKSAASGKTGEQSSIGVGCAPGEERDSAISICAVHSATVTARLVFSRELFEKNFGRPAYASTGRAPLTAAAPTVSPTGTKSVRPPPLALIQPPAG